MQRDRVSKAVRVLGGTIGGAFLVLGVAELVTHLDEPLTLFFWLPTLWGGGALVLIGVFGWAARTRQSPALMIVGAFLGLVAAAWTVVLPVLVLAFVVLVVVRARRRPPAPTAPASPAPGV